MLQKTSESPTDQARPIEDGSDSDFLRSRACTARNDVRRAFRVVGSSLWRAANPCVMVRYHPIGTTVAVGVAAAVGASRLKSIGKPWPKRGLIGDAFHAVRGIMVSSLISRGAMWLAGAPQAPDAGPDPAPEATL